MDKLKKTINIYLILLLTIFSCKDSIHRVSRPQLGTIVNLTIISDNETASEASSAVFNEIERIENLMSLYVSDSEISKINSNAGKKNTFVSKEIHKMIKKSVEISVLTNGAFDITFASIGNLWDFKNENFEPPLSSKINKKIHLVNFKNIQINNNYSIFLKKHGMKIGLGGIAKGYAVQRGVEVLQEKGVKSAIVEEGGDLQVLGTKYGKRWKTGLIHPRGRKLFLTIDLDNLDSIATSGDYERFIMYRGKRYSHIIDPRTGYPTNTFASVSVVSKDPVLSDAYATALFVMGVDDAIKFLNFHKNISVVMIDIKMNIYISKQLKNRIKLLEERKINWL